MGSNCEQHSTCGIWKERDKPKRGHVRYFCQKTCSLGNGLTKDFGLAVIIHGVPQASHHAGV